MTIMDERHASAAPLAKQAIEMAASVMGMENASCEAYIVGNAFMEKNVLAYPSPAGFPRPDLGERRDLGEIYLNPGYIAAHGEDLRFMAVHGFLHLLGYDHTAEHDTLAMEEKEAKIMGAMKALIQ